MTEFLNITPEQLTSIKSAVKTTLRATDYRLYVFGSRSGNTPCKPYSDLDLAIKAPTPIPRHQLFALEDLLEESDLPFRVDIIDWHRISTDFQNTIKNQLTPIR